MALRPTGLQTLWRSAQQGYALVRFPSPVPVSKKRIKFVRSMMIVLSLLSSLVLAGCNTVRGLGQDIESVADAGDEAL